MLRLGGVGFAPYPHIFLEVNFMPTTLPWYNHCYAARFPVLLEGVGKLFSGTFDAIYSDYPDGHAGCVPELHRAGSGGGSVFHPLA